MRDADESSFINDIGRSCEWTRFGGASRKRREMNLSVAGGGSIERASGTRMERKFDRRARLVERPATTDYIYAYLMRVHNARERGAMTRRSRGGGEEEGPGNRVSRRRA